MKMVKKQKFQNLITKKDFFLYLTLLLTPILTVLPFYLFKPSMCVLMFMFFCSIGILILYFLKRKKFTEFKYLSDLFVIDWNFFIILASLVIISVYWFHYPTEVKFSITLLATIFSAILTVHMIIAFYIYTHLTKRLVFILILVIVSLSILKSNEWPVIALVTSLFYFYNSKEYYSYKLKKDLSDSDIPIKIKVKWLENKEYIIMLSIALLSSFFICESRLGLFFKQEVKKLFSYTFGVNQKDFILNLEISLLADILLKLVFFVIVFAIISLASKYYLQENKSDEISQTILENLE